MTLKAYLLSFPERIVRSAVGLGAGVARELGAVALPEGIRRSQLYQNLVDATLRYLIEQVGGVEGVYSVEGTLPDNFLARRTAGNAVEVLGIVAFRASPVWVLAALADLCGMGRHLIPEMADALKAQGLLEKNAQFTSIDQILDGLERTSSRLAATINTPPFDVAGLRKDWEAIREEARRLPSASLPSRETISRVWAQLKTESARQDRSVFETSSMMAIAAVRALPDGFRWLSASARVGAMRTGHIVAAALLDHYTQTLSEIQQVGYLAYAGRQFQPYVRAAVDQFSPKRRTLTQRLLEKLQSIRTVSGERTSTTVPVPKSGLTRFAADGDKSQAPHTMVDTPLVLEYSIEADVSPAFAWKFRTDITTWSDPPATFQLDGPFAEGSRGMTLMPGQEPLAWWIRDVRPGHSFAIEMPLDQATLRFEWHVGAVSERRTRLTNRIILAGHNMGTYRKQVEAGFGANLAAGLGKVAQAMVAAENTARTLNGRDDR